MMFDPNEINVISERVNLLIQYQNQPNTSITIELPSSAKAPYTNNSPKLFIDSKLLPIIFTPIGGTPWCWRNGRIVTSSTAFGHKFYHRLITQCPPEKEVEFINDNPYNFCKSNLRVVDRVLRRRKNLDTNSPLDNFIGMLDD